MDIDILALSRARQQLETHGRFPGDDLPGDITDSWLRSLSHGLDPLARNSRMILSQCDFTAVQQTHADLIRFARPELELLYDQIAGSNFMVALGSSDGIVLDRLCDSQFSQTAVGAQVVPGSVWSEALRGTNAMGMCISTKRPAQVYGGEHFMRAHTDVSCLSAPIFDGKGHLAGVLDASSTATVRQHHTAALVQMSATSIENTLIRCSHEHHFVLQFHPRQEYLGTLSMGLLVVEEDGTIHAVNRRGEMILTGFATMLGAAFDTLFDARFHDILPRLIQGETLKLRDRLGAAVSLRCVANRASFASARRSSVVPASPAALAHKNLFRDVVIEDALLWRRLSSMPEAAKRGTTIHISGETGTGKEMVARLCHAATGRTGKFILLDSALGCTSDLAQACSQGNASLPVLLTQAAGGTIYLDDVTQISATAQSQLVQIIDHNAYRQHDTGEMIATDVRIISSITTKAGVAALDWGQITPALRYRLEGFRIGLPPLRERSDLGALAARFARSCRAPMRIDPKALRRLAQHDWPGNLHELRALIIQAVLQTRSDVLRLQDIEPLLLTKPAVGPAAADHCAACAGVPWKVKSCQSIRSHVAALHGNVSQAARELGMSRTTIYKHLSRDAGTAQ